MNIVLLRRSSFPVALLFSAVAGAAVAPVPGVSTLPGFTVTAPSVANLAAAGTFAMPVTALRYEPRVDLQARNLAEAQADITLRGGTFETTGFRLGGLSLADPQTGHYLTELPLAPAMLGVPQVLAGAEAALGVSNATAGAVAQDWRPVSNGDSFPSGRGNSRSGAPRSSPVWFRRPDSELTSGSPPRGPTAPYGSATTNSTAQAYASSPAAARRKPTRPSAIRVSASAGPIFTRRSAPRVREPPDAPARPQPPRRSWR